MPFELPFQMPPYTLSLLLAIPIIGSIVVFLLPASRPKAAKVLAILFSAVPLVLSSLLWLAFDCSVPPGQYQFMEQHPYVPKLGISYIVGIDGISFPLVWLTALLCLLAIVFSWDENRRVKEFFALMLVMEVGVFGVFMALDFVVFYIFWELVLIPMYFLIAIWGGPRKRYASIKFFIYTHIASLFMLIAILAIYLNVPTAHPTFSFIDIAEAAPGLPLTFQLPVFLVLFIGFGVKMPIVPFHTWLPDAHVEAPTAGSVLLAGLLLKMGGYGLIRITGLMFLPALQQAAPLLYVFAVVSIIHASLACLAQRDLKRLVAYSSVSHMGLVLLGVASCNKIGLMGANYQMFAHGLITAVLFMMAGSIHHKVGTREIPELGGIASKIPAASTVLVYASLASLGLPGLASFPSEVMVFIGAFQQFAWFVMLPLVGVILTAAFYLWMLQRAVFGPLNRKLEGRHLHDLYPFEEVPLIVLVLLIAVFGVFPGLLTETFGQALPGVLP